jgi:hypothetical protein
MKITIELDDKKDKKEVNRVLKNTDMAICIFSLREFYIKNIANNKNLSNLSESTIEEFFDIIESNIGDLEDLID